MQPEKIVTAGVIFVVTAVFIGAVAWMGLGFLRNGEDGVVTAPVSSAPGKAPLVTEPAGPALNATQIGEFLGLPTQPLSDQPTPQLTYPSQPVAITPEAQTLMNIDVDRLLAEMSLDEKIGQMIMTGVPGEALDAQTVQLINDYHIGSVVYFGENTRNLQQVSQYSLALQQAAAGSGRGIPLLIALDHEGGRVFRFQNGVTHFPNPMTLGAARSTDLAFRVAVANAQELKAAGVNLDLAPVLDVNDEPLNPVIGLRAFAGFADLVSSLGIAYIQGLQGNGVIAVAKHFPGHGSTRIDSHEALPVVDKSLADLEKQELAPFRAAVQAGVGAVMVGHIAMPQIDPSGTPASLSPEILQTLLRQNLGYNGVVMTDAMSMGAIVGEYSPSEAAVGAVNAGCDLVAYTDAGAAVTARNVLLQAVKSGQISQTRVDEATRRVLVLKARAGLFSPSASETVFDSAAHAQLARELATQAVSMVGAANLPLIAADRIVLITPNTLPVGSQEGDGLSLLGELLANKGIQVDEWVYPVDDAAGISAIQSQALAAAQRFPQTLVVASDALLNQAQNGNSAQVNLINAFQASGIPVLVIAAGSPFDLALIPANRVGLAIYGSLPPQIEALVEALLSPVAPVGTLPVPLSR